VPQAASKTSQPLPSSLGPLALLAEPGHALIRWTDGSERYVAYALIHLSAQPPVFIAVGAREGTMTADARALGFQGGLAFLLVAIASLGLTWWGGVRFIRRPLGMLAEVALRWRDGDQSARASLPGRSENATLGRVFNAMADAKDQSDLQTRESADLLAALIESSRDCIFVTDPDGYLLLANSTFLEIVGLTREAAIGCKLVIQHDHTMQQALEVLRAQVATTRMLQADDVSVRAFEDDQPRILQTMCTPIFNSTGQIRAIAGIGRDVTDAHQAAKALRLARDRAEAADRAKTRFLAAASHDLRQPLQAAVLLAELLNSQADSGAPPSWSVSNLRRALDDIKYLVDSLFDVSRLDSGAVTPDISSFPLQGLLDQTIILYQKVAEDKGISLLAAPTDAIIRSDPVLLGRMLANLVENAVRYTLSGHVLIECEPIGAHLRIHIEDTGIGISKQDLSRIWDEFEQLKNPARDRRQGLGLSIVRRLSTLLDHPVEVSSEPGKGSSFVVTVPVDEQHVTSSSQTPTNRTSSGPDNGHLVVVVDDDPLLLDTLHMALEDNGWSVIAATDYAEAINRLTAGKRPPDVIISDYRLGEGKVGSEVIKGIREMVGRQLPAVILTGELGTIGDNHDQPKEDARRLNASLLRKPVRMTELLAAMRLVMATTAP
jgi:PAS domain S-box-containing protein